MARTNPPEKPNEALVLFALSSYANKAGTCFPGFDALSKATRLSRASVKRAIHGLVEQGKIKRVIGNGKIVSHYQILGSHRPQGKVTQTPERVQNDPGEGSHRPPEVVVKRPLKNTEKKPVAPMVLPDWLSLEIWTAYLEHRKAKRAKLTPHAMELCFRHLAEWHSQGQDVKAIIEQSIANGWTGLFPLKSNGNGSKSASDQAYLDKRIAEEESRLRAAHGPASAQSFDEDIPF